MKFIDFEAVIRDKYPILIESYVSQYGEEYRHRITEVLERCQYCIFESPVNLRGYVRSRKVNDLMKIILTSYIDVGLSIDGIKIDLDELIIEDNKLSYLTNILFPDLSSYDALLSNGIFLFDSKYDYLEYDDPIFKKKIKVLEDLGYKKKDISVDDFLYSVEYLDACCKLNKLLLVINRNIDYYGLNDYQEYIDYAEELEEKMNNLSSIYERKYLEKIREYLSDEDKILLDSGEDIKKLKDYYLYFDDSLESDEYCFSEGCLEYFCDYYTNLLKKKSTCKTEINEIIDERLKYLSRRGFDISKLDRKDLLCDWYSLEYLKDYLPDKGIVSECLLRRDSVEDELQYEIAKIFIINGYELGREDSEIDTIISSDGQSCSFNHRQKDFDYNNIRPVICISPLDELYNLFDIALDHELRHAIELCIKKKGNCYVVKIGSDISVLNSKFDGIKTGFTNYNEVLTQKLSVEATKRRWENKEFIFSDCLALITISPISSYDDAIENLDIIFEPFRDELTKVQMSEDGDDVFSIIPRKDLRVINREIYKLTPSSKKKLEGIRDRLIEKRCFKEKVLSKEFNN